ncbi:MAG: TonB-dependent receptor [Myxococcales bacterium]|nr:TonB-dependent receptor [Myxococcales bacterium]
MALLSFRHKDPVHEFDASLYFTRYNLARWDNFTFFKGDPLGGDAIEQDDARVYAGAHVAYHFHSHLGPLSLRSTIGLQSRHDTTHVELWNATSQGGEYRKRTGRLVDGSRFHFGNDDDIAQLNLSAYVEEDMVVARWLRAIVGIRADYFGFQGVDRGEALGAGNPSTSGVAQRSLLSPKATVVLTPTRPLDLYLNFGMGFHSNDARIAVQEGRVTHEGSVVNTVPRIYGGEIGARLDLWGRVAIAAAAWASYLENETVFTGDGGVFEPSDPTRRIGVDLEVRARIFSWLFADVDLAQAAATSLPREGEGGALALAPKLYMTGGLTVKHPVGVRAGLRFRYLGPRPAFDETSEEYRTLHPTEPKRVNTEGFFVVDLYGAWRWRFLEASLSVQNLFNSTWREAQFGNHSCTRGETTDTTSSSYAVCGVSLAAAARTGVADVHFTPGVPLHLELTLKAYC